MKTSGRTIQTRSWKREGRGGEGRTEWGDHWRNWVSVAQLQTSHGPLMGYSPQVGDPYSTMQRAGGAPAKVFLRRSTKVRGEREERWVAINGEATYGLVFLSRSAYNTVHIIPKESQPASHSVGRSTSFSYFTSLRGHGSKATVDGLPPPPATPARFPPAPPRWGPPGSG